MVGRLAALMRRNQKGFTLVELMVVVLIIGILVAIAIPLYTKSQENAQRNACKANLRTMMGSIAQYASEHNGSYPSSLDDLQSGGYLKSVPTCPGGGTYTYDSTNGTVKCSLETTKDHKI